MASTIKSIEMKGVRVHNLKNIDVAIPKNKLVVITGVSGSGKSSLMIDTLYAEGQRRYVESLNAYARQFLSRMNKPDVDYIKGICPAIAIEQKVVSKNSRSTVGSMTELYDYFRLLFTHIGITYHPTTGQEVKQHTVTDVMEFIFTLKPDTKIYLLLPIIPKYKRTFTEELQVLIQKGFTRLIENNDIINLEDFLRDHKYDINKAYYLVIDRFILNDFSEEFQNRVSDSILTAFSEGDDTCIIRHHENDVLFNAKFECEGIKFETPTPHFFNFNNPYGACTTCEGYGSVIGIDASLVIPDATLSVYEGAIACWKGEKMDEYRQYFMKKASKEYSFPIHKPIIDLSKNDYDLLWNGNEKVYGIKQFFEFVESQTYKIQYRVMLSRYRGRTTCPDCHGARIRKDASYVRINDASIHDLLQISIWDLQQFFSNIKLSKTQEKIAERVLYEINSRLQFMVDVGLGYLTLNRLSGTLSGGETQRINLTRAIGSNLSGSLYILDEPSIGLHPRDTENLIRVLKQLRNLGNTVVIVEHEEAIMQAADYIIDMGPEAGSLGGQVVAEGDMKSILNNNKSITSQYLNGTLKIQIDLLKRKATEFIGIEKCTLHNLKNVKIHFPLQSITTVSGVSGSGKTTLIKHLLYPALSEYLESKNQTIATKHHLTGDIHRLDHIEIIDQEPIGKSSRSNPVTYVKAFDAIRDLFAKLKISQLKGFKPGTFSFNIEGGRCEACKGEGEQVVSMQFLADVHLICEECQGKRFRSEVLEVKYKNKNIFDVLEMTIDEAVVFFADNNDILQRIKPLQDIGLGYVQLGQSSSTLSGGEAQRVKLASYLVKDSSSQKILFIFDEPTTGLHFHDINKLLKALRALIIQGHTVLVIEHNIDVIKCADWVIDLGPDGGDGGGQLLYQGEINGLLECKNSHTATYLKIPPIINRLTTHQEKDSPLPFIKNYFS